MHYSFAFPRLSQKTMAALLILASLLIVAYSPMVSFSAAQSASELQQLKKKVTDELSRRITNFQKTISSFGSVPTVTSAISPKPLESAPTKLPSDIQSSVKTFVVKTVDGLQSMKDKVGKANSLSSMQLLAKNIDSQYEINKVANAQAAVTQSIESSSGVLEKLQSTFSNVQGQVAKLKTCAQNNATSSGCDALNGDASSAQSQLDSFLTVGTTISSIISSAIALLISIVLSFSSIAGKLGNLGSLDNLGNLSNLTNLEGLAGISGSLTGLTSSLTAITSQLDITGSMSGGASSSLTGLASSINQ